MEVIVGLITLVVGVLQIILFFKIWGMTNNVSDIKELLIQQSFLSNSMSEIEKKVDSHDKFYVDQLVVLLSTEEQMKIKEITPNGMYGCYTNGGSNFRGNFYEKEIEDFETYWNRKKGYR